MHACIVLVRMTIQTMTIIILIHLLTWPSLIITSLHVVAGSQRRMSWVLALLLLAISKPAVSQCDYVYVAQPPASQLICDPFPINRLQLVCSLFVQQVPELLTIQWFFSTTPVSGLQVGRVDARLLRQVDFQVARPDTFTSRIVVRQFINFLRH